MTPHSPKPGSPCARRRSRVVAAAGNSLALVALAGCATGQAPVVDRLSGDRVRGDADHVSVLGGRLDALPLAVLHCSRYGRAAQFDRLDGDRSVYDCLPKPQ